MKKIKAAWIEQILEFDSVHEYQAYIQKLLSKPGKFKEMDKNRDDEGRVTLRIRKQYNNNDFPED